MNANERDEMPFKCSHCLDLMIWSFATADVATTVPDAVTFENGVYI